MTRAASNYQPEEHRCAICKRRGAGFGSRLRWYCEDHVPADYWPVGTASRAEADAREAAASKESGLALAGRPNPKAEAEKPFVAPPMVTPKVKPQGDLF